MQDRQSTSTRQRLPGLLSALGTGSGQVGVQVRERVLTYLSSVVRMIETPDPANCASCPENYYSVCPVQRTKGPCDGSGQQCPAQGGPGPAPIRPSLGHLLHSHPHHLSRALPPTLLEQAGRVASPNPPSQAYWLSPALSPGSGKLANSHMLLSASAKVVMANVCVVSEGGGGGRSRSHLGAEPDPQSQTWRVYMRMLTSSPNALELRKLWPREGAGTF